jgi:hypothetical protein
MINLGDFVDFYGGGLTMRQYESFTLQKINPADRLDEPGLMLSRWFDYSQMHPAEATYLFAHFYKEQTRKFCEAYIDIRTAEEARAFTPDDIFNSRDITAMWLARVCADTVGAPYPFVLQFVQERALARTFQCFPRPNQLYGEEFELDLAAAWRDKVSISMQYSRLSRFQRSAYQGSIIQKRHHEFVVGQIKKRPAAAHPGLIARMCAEGLFDQHSLASDFPNGVVEQAFKIAKN